MTTYNGSTVRWVNYPDLILPGEERITVPESIIRQREREAFIQAARNRFDFSDHQTARTAIDGMLDLLKDE